MDYSVWHSSGGGSGATVDADGLAEFYRHPLPADRPTYLRTNFIASLDGSVQGPDGRSGTINTPSDHHVFALHRAMTDVVLVGAGTVRDEGYRAVDLADWQRDLRAAEGLTGFPTLAVVTASLELDPVIATPRSGSGGPVLVITGSAAPAAAVQRFREAGVEVVVQDDSRVDLAEALADLGARGLRRVLCEGGPRLHRDLLDGGHVDELSLSLAPVAVGGRGQRSTSGDPLDRPAGFTLDLCLFAAQDQTLFTRYRRRSG